MYLTIFLKVTYFVLTIVPLLQKDTVTEGKYYVRNNEERKEIVETMQRELNCKRGDESVSRTSVVSL